MVGELADFWEFHVRKKKKQTSRNIVIYCEKRDVVAGLMKEILKMTTSLELQWQGLSHQLELAMEGGGDSGYWCLHNDFMIVLGWGKQFILSADLPRPWRPGCLWGLPQASQGTQHSLCTFRKPTASCCTPLPEAAAVHSPTPRHLADTKPHRAPSPQFLLPSFPKTPHSLPRKPPVVLGAGRKDPFWGTARKNCFSESTPVPGPGAPRQVWHTEGHQPVFLELTHSESESLPLPRFRFAHFSSRNGGKILFLVTENPVVCVCIPGLVWKEVVEKTKPCYVLSVGIWLRG